MRSLPGPVEIFLYSEPADLRKSYDSLAAMVREHLERSVLDGGLFVFLNRRSDSGTKSPLLVYFAQQCEKPNRSTTGWLRIGLARKND